MTIADGVVFVIDDDAAFRESLNNLFRSIGVRAETFASAQEFLRSQRQHTPGCVVLDVRMPGLSGLDLQKRMAEAEIGIPIVFVTGHGDIQMSVQAMKAGAVEFLTKPFRDQDLLDAVQRALERDRAAHDHRTEGEGLRSRFDSLTPRQREMMERVVAVIDDDAAFRESLNNLLRSIGLRVETFASAQEFLSSERRHIPGCVVLDVRMPGLSGLDLQKRMVDAEIGIPIVFVTGHGDIQMSVQAMKAGAVEFLTKPFRDQDLLDAVQRALERDRAARDHRAEGERLRSRFDSLTPREREVMERVVAGLLNKQIARALGTSEPTVKIQRHNVMQKMKAGSLADLVRMADRLGIVIPQS